MTNKEKDVIEKGDEFNIEFLRRRNDTEVVTKLEMKFCAYHSMSAEEYCRIPEKYRDNLEGEIQDSLLREVMINIYNDANEILKLCKIEIEKYMQIQMVIDRKMGIPSAIDINTAIALKRAKEFIAETDELIGNKDAARRTTSH